jgi:S1/P1 Nuclease
MGRFLGAVGFAASLPLLAWGPEGHRLVARIAASELTLAAQSQVAEILGPGQTMASVASWADDVRHSRPETAKWHFIDIPIGKAHLDMTRDCAKGDCIVGELLKLRHDLQDPATPAAERREALMFLIHFIGDMHEPLHCANNQDRGGNSVRVVFHDRPTSLHSLWDSGLLNRMASEDELFADLSAVAAHQERKWAKGGFADWANDSHKAARKMVYRLLPPAAADSPHPISAKYEAKADLLVKEQIAKAGVRLAATLNTALQ